MDCCCKTQPQPLQKQPNHNQHQDKTNLYASTPLKAKFSFKTSSAHYQDYFRSALRNTNDTYGQKQTIEGKQYGGLSTVCSNNELVQLQRQKMELIREEQNIDRFYYSQVIPLEKQVEYFQRQIKIRENQITQLSSLLEMRLRQGNHKINHINTTNITNVNNYPFANNRNEILRVNSPKSNVVMNQWSNNLPIQTRRV